MDCIQMTYFLIPYNSKKENLIYDHNNKGAHQQEVSIVSGSHLHKKCGRFTFMISHPTTI